MSDHYSRDAHRYLDGEPHAPLGDAEREAADRLRAAAGAARAALGTTPAAFDARVMAHLRAATPPRRVAAVGWAARRIRLHPVAIPLAAAAAVALWFGGRASVRGSAPAQALPPVAAADTVFVRFAIRAPAARQVALAGDFNGWEPGAIPLVRDDEGEWTITLPLAVGEHRYQFVVDGATWVPDPRAETVDDGFGGRNSVIVVGPRGVVRS